VTNVTTKFVARLKVLEKLQNVMAVTIEEYPTTPASS
jgi:hypothetical protein